MLNARVRRTCGDESRIHDANMVDESRDKVDVLLVLVSMQLPLLCFVTENVKDGPFLGGRHDLCRSNIAEFTAGLCSHLSFSTL